MKNYIALSIVSSLSLLLIGCANYQTVTKTQLEKATAEWQEPKVSIWYYVGSQDGYHHYLHRDLPEDQLYRVSESEFNQTDQFPITRNDKKWKVMPWGVHALKQ